MTHIRQQSRLEVDESSTSKNLQTLALFSLDSMKGSHCAHSQEEGDANLMQLQNAVSAVLKNHNYKFTCNVLRSRKYSSLYQCASPAEAVDLSDLVFKWNALDPVNGRSQRLNQSIRAGIVSVSRGAPMPLGELYGEVDRFARAARPGGIFIDLATYTALDPVVRKMFGYRIRVPVDGAYLEGYQWRVSPSSKPTERRNSNANLSRSATSLRLC
ncbi:MAG: hypothetical protein ACPGOY_09195 [Rhodospirillaceae bacterium]